MRRILACASLFFAIACGDDPGPADSGVVPPDLGVAVEDAGIERDAGGIASGRVSLSAETIDFGAVVVTSTATMTLTITNPGNETVQVTISEILGPNADRFSRSLNTPDEMGAFNIEPNGVVTLTVSVVPNELGPIIGVIALDSCGGKCPAAIVLQAIGVETGLFCPPRVELGTVNPGSCLAFDISCENRGNATERITVVELEPTSSPDYALTEPALPVDLGPGETLSFNVEYCPTEARASAADIRVATFRPFETERTIHLEGIGGGADVTCEPAELAFGTVGIGASINQSLTCRNSGVDPATVTAVLAEGMHFSISSQPDMPIPPGGSGTIVVTASPMILGTLTDTLEVSTNDPDAPRIDIAMTLDAIMAEPCGATIMPGMRDFGLVGIGESRRARLTVTNTGANVCLLRRVEMATGSSPTFTVVDGPSPGSSIDPGTTFTVDVAFAPTANAISSGTLSVSFSNPGTSVIDAPLTGSGGNVPVRVTPDLIDFGATPVGCAAPLPIRVSMVRMLASTGPITSAAIANESTSGVFSVDTSGLPTVVALGEEFAFNVGFQPATAGIFTGELHIIAGGLPTPIIIHLQGEGTSAATRTETFTFDAPRIDVLFVIDNGESMSAAQAALAQAINVFGQALIDRQADFHFGVISTDMEDLTQQGRLIGGYADSNTPQLITDLVARVQVGDNGNGNGRPFDAVQAALTEPLLSTANAGFRRLDAELAIVFIGDEDDQSTAAPPIPTRVSELKSLAGGQRLHLASIAGTPNEACVGVNGGADAGSRYAQLVLRGGGSIYSFCADMTENVRAIAGALLGSPAFSLGLQPRVASLMVEVDNMSIGMGWSFDLSRAILTFTDVSLVPTGSNIRVTYEPFCLSATCGNGATDAREECDDMNADDTDDCTTQCLSAYCGDGFTRSGSEQCDDANLVNTDECVAGCVAAVCGDGYLQAGVEECDDGNVVGADGCPATCRFYVVTGPVNLTYTPLTAPTPIVFAGAGDPLDDGQAELTLPFPFTFFDLPSTTVNVSVNGFISFATFAEPDSFQNVSLPDAAPPNAIIAAWWDNLYVDAAQTQPGSVAWEVIGVAPNREAVIEWRDLRRADHSTNNHRRFTFQIRLAEGTGLIRLRYEESETSGNPMTATSASAGIEDHAGGVGREALGCSPGCAGPPRPQNANGFPEQTEVTFEP